MSIKNISLPNYDNCITNLACSIQKYFNLNPKHKTIHTLDEVLEKTNPKNVVVLLFDGMGTNLLKRKLEKEDFLMQHLVTELTSVAPATTTAATTSMMTGLNPVEHGWLGWDLYIKPVDKVVTMFMNKVKDTGEIAADYDVSRTYYPYKTIIQQINEAGEYTAKDFFPFGEDPYTDNDDLTEKIVEECSKEGKKYLYAYLIHPDSMMHDLGTEAKEVNEYFKEIGEIVKGIADQLEDTLIIVTADHGHLECDNILLTEYPDFFETLARTTWIESRCCAFKVKEGKEKEFENLFEKYFGKDFILKTKEEVIEAKLFGDGEENKLFRDSLGDYLALAITNKDFRYDERTSVLKSIHAGFTEDEMNIPLILISK